MKIGIPFKGGKRRLQNIEIIALVIVVYPAKEHSLTIGGGSIVCG
ncbi:hypothetical protein [Paenibacillus luteus]|nr:hypothetical protein [Paenibacillus luteus]